MMKVFGAAARSGGHSQDVRFGLIASVLLAGTTPVGAQTIYGTLSNFDVFNQTTVPVYGAELELQGVHVGEVYSLYPAHFNNIGKQEYFDPNSNAFLGTRITYTGYNFPNAGGAVTPTPGQSTNGHFCVGIPGCEHFGYSITVQPSATRYYWLDQSNQRVNSTPLTISAPVWSFVPAIPNEPPVLQAEIRVPEPEVPVQRPDSVWVKVYKTEVNRPVDLGELVSGNNLQHGGIVPENEIETEWELLEGGRNRKGEPFKLLAKAQVGAGAQAIVRRYEFFQYTGAYDAEHEPLSAFLDKNSGLVAPPVDELGNFIAANIVAANLAPVPEPDTYALMFVGLGLVGLQLRHKSLSAAALRFI